MSTTIIPTIFNFCHEKQVGAGSGKAWNATAKRWREQTGVWASRAAGWTQPAILRAGRANWVSVNKPIFQVPGELAV